MKIFHYTTIETLALILKNKTIRFNRLNLVDDLEEGSISPQGIKIGQYVFVSCWTDVKEESIPLWKMYTDGGIGVRISLEKDMFKDYLNPDIITLDGNIRFNARMSGYKISKTPIEDFFNPGKMVLPIQPAEIDKIYKKIEYVDNLDEKMKDSVIITREPNGYKTISLNTDKLGQYKNARWSFQEESRFCLIILPGKKFNSVESVPKEFNDHLYNVWNNNLENSISYYDMSINEDAIKNIEITLSPNIPESKKIIVKALMQTYAPTGSTKNSSLDSSTKIK